MPLSPTDLDALLGSTLFRSLRQEDIATALPSCSVISIAAGETLLQPGRENSRIYILLDGELRVHVAGFDAPPQAKLGVGDCVGEMSLVDGQPVSAWVVTASDVRLLAIPHDLLWALVERSHAVARNLLGILSGRVRTNNIKLVAAQSDSLEFEDAASVDPLTGLHNRRWLLSSIPRVLQRGEKDGQPVVLVLADLDRFMRFCEHLTALQRDEVLRHVGIRLADTMRAQDLIARYGDDKFIVVLTRTEIDEGMVIAERLREHVARLSFAGTEDMPPLTLSCGLARHHPGESLEELLARADEALHRAKESGRDCVEADF